MVGYGFVLLPLYIYPSDNSTWSPLINAANKYPNVNFTAVINPYNGPGGGNCPPAVYVDPIASLNAVPNINLLGYVHTANQYTCNTICTCSAPLQELENNVTTYQNWPTSGCSSDGSNSKDIHVDGIFIDEAPSNNTCLSYMTSAAGFVKSTLTRGNTVLFNAGSSVDSSYFGIADYINVFENNEAAFDTVDIGGLDGNGKYSRQSTLLIYDYTDGATTLQRDVTTVLSFAQDSIAGLYISNLNSYSQFPTIWDEFVADVAAVVASNMASSS